MKQKEEYERIVVIKNESGIIEKVFDNLLGNCVFYMLCKLVIREDVVIIKVRMVFEVSMKFQYLVNSINDCLQRGLCLQLFVGYIDKSEDFNRYFIWG